MLDISDTLAPNSDQLDAVDLLGGPRTFTIEKVSRGNAEQPVNVHLAEFPRVWRPGKSMRRVLASCWGTDASVWVGRRVTLYCDGAVEFGGKAVGGTRISHLSHLDRPRKIPLLVTRGRSATFTVQPLTDTPAAPVPAEPVDASRPGYEQVIADAVAAGYGALAPTEPPPGLESPGDTPTGDMITRPQMQKMQALFTERGLTDRAAKLTYASDVVGRDITTSTDLTRVEASDLIDALEKDK